MSTRTRSTPRRRRHYGRDPSERDENFRSPDSSDVANGEPAFQVPPDSTFYQVEPSPVELSESGSTRSDEDLSDRRSPSSPTDESDLDTTRVGFNEQRNSNLASSSSGKSELLESNSLAACRSIAELLHRLCDKLIGSIEDTWSHINEPSFDHNEIQEHTGQKNTRDLAGMQDSTHPINALNIQQLDLANIMKAELIQLEAVAGEYAAGNCEDQI